MYFFCILKEFIFALIHEEVIVKGKRHIVFLNECKRQKQMYGVCCRLPSKREILKSFKQLPKKSMQGDNKEPELHIFFEK